MKKYLVAVGVLLSPCLAFADRLGGLKSSADVLLTTQAVVGSGTSFSLAVSTGTNGVFPDLPVSSSSLRTQIIFDSNTFTASLTGGATVFIAAPNFLLNSSATANYMTLSSNTANDLKMSSAAVTYRYASKVVTSSITCGPSLSCTGTNNVVDGAPIVNVNQSSVPVLNGSSLIYNFQIDGSSITKQGPIISSMSAATQLATSQFNSGASASNSTFWRGDGTWASPAGSGDAVLNATQTWSGANTYKGSSTFNGPVLDRANGAGNLTQVLASSGPGLGVYWKDDSGGASVTFTTKTVLFNPESFQTLESSFCVYASTGFGAINYSILICSNSATTEFMNGKFLIDPHAVESGTATFVLCGRAAVPAANNVAFNFDELDIASGNATIGSYNTVASGDLTLSATAGVMVCKTWTSAMHSLGWADDDEVFFKLSRVNPSGTELANDFYFFNFRVSYPVGLQ